MPAGAPTGGAATAPGSAGSTTMTTTPEQPLKSGSATASSILGIYASGDCSIEAAARNGGITRIDHVDHHTWNVVGFYSEFTTTVYGY
jgi:hypothetical protein